MSLPAAATSPSRLPSPSLPVSGSPLSPPSLGSQGNLCGESVTPFHLLSSKPLDQGDSFLFHTCDVSQRAAEPCEQSSSWVFPMAAAVRFDPGSSAGVSRQQAPDPTLSGLCGGGSWGEITAVASYSLARLRRTPVGMLGGGGGFLPSLSRCHFSSSCLDPSARSTSFLLSRSFICP